MTDTTVQMVAPYPARLRIDYKEQLDRGTTLVRIFWIIPIAIILVLATGGFGASTTTEQGERTRSAGASIALSLSANRYDAAL